jgi:hypothetical protein
MGQRSPHGLLGIPQVLCAVSAVFVLLIACGANQSAIDAAVNATRTADKAASDAAVPTASEALPGVRPTIAPAVAEPSGASFSDDFGQPTLAPGWAWTREDPAAWSLTDRSGWLRLTTRDADLLGPGGTAPLLLQAAPGTDFELRTLIEFAPTKDFHFAGLMVYQDDDHFVALGRSYCGLVPVCLGDGVYFDNDEAFMAGDANVVAQGGLPAGQAIWLRLVREGATYTGLWSSDGASWTSIGTTTTELTPKYVGLMATNGETGAVAAAAYFDIFEVLAPPEPIDGQAASCPESMADLRYVSHGYLESGWFLVTLGKPGGFESSEYTLRVNGSPFECTTLSGRLDRIYCTGRTAPPPGLVQVELLDAGSSCTFGIPFASISVLPKPQPTSSGGYY